MVKVAVTGGIGSGKSYVCKLLEMRGISIYDCDKAAKHIMASSEDIQSELNQWTLVTITIPLEDK